MKTNLEIYRESEIKVETIETDIEECLFLNRMIMRLESLNKEYNDFIKTSSLNEIKRQFLSFHESLNKSLERFVAEVTSRQV